MRELAPTDEGHYTVYLPAFAEQTLVERLRYLSRTVRWEVFQKHSERPATHGNVRVWPVSGGDFLQSLASAHGVLCGAGFETPAEALYLGKTPAGPAHEAAVRAAVQRRRPGQNGRARGARPQRQAPRPPRRLAAPRPLRARRLPQPHRRGARPTADRATGRENGRCYAENLARLLTQLKNLCGSVRHCA
ncbi:MAG: glycosyltransferase family protein [Hymenobacter sp.]